MNFFAANKSSGKIWVKLHVTGSKGRILDDMMMTKNQMIKFYTRKSEREEAYNFLRWNMQFSPISYLLKQSSMKLKAKR